MLVCTESSEVTLAEKSFRAKLHFLIRDMLVNWYFMKPLGHKDPKYTPEYASRCLLFADVRNPWCWLTINQIVGSQLLLLVIKKGKNISRLRSNLTIDFVFHTSTCILPGMCRAIYSSLHVVLDDRWRRQLSKAYMLSKELGKRYSHLLFLNV